MIREKEVMTGRLEGKVAIVTGGARGLGAAMVRRFADAGAKVVAADVRDEEGARLAAETPNCQFERLDVTSEANWKSLVEATESRFGPVSILVNNAGISRLGLIEEMSEATYMELIRVNQLGVFLGMKSVVASMRRAGGGAIINMSSIAGLKGTPTAVAYSASKFAVRGMTKVAAVEFGKYGIRVNSIHPGTFDTDMIRHEDGTIHEVIEDVMAGLPAGRIGDPDEIAQMALLLASDEMRIATGAEFILDGGATCR